MRIAATLLLAACSGSPSAETDGAPPGQGIPMGQGPNEAALLKKGPPEPGAAGRAITKLAGALGLGIVRCPIDGMGRVTQVFGTPRDQLRPVGPTWTLELRPEDVKPWNPTYDVVPVEDKWITLLADEGSTGSWIRAADRTVKLTWPAAKKGGEVICSAVEDVAPRVVTGRVEPRTGAMWTVGCTEDAEEVASDGTFVIDAAVPCTLWLESRDAQRTQKVRIEGGSGKKELTDLVWAADDIQDAERQWTDQGKARLKEIALKLADDITYQFETLDKIKGELDGDEPAQKVVERWHNEMTDWQNMTQRIHAGIEGKVPL